MLTRFKRTLIIHECHVCEPRGGCLAVQLLDSEELHQQLCHARKINRKGEHLFREGESADCFYVVRSGSLKSYLVTEDGEEQVLGFYLPGDVFGLDTTESQPAHVVIALALETTSICRFPHAYLARQTAGHQLVENHR